MSVYSQTAVLTGEVTWEVSLSLPSTFAAVFWNGGSVRGCSVSGVDICRLERMDGVSFLHSDGIGMECYGIVTG